MRTHDSRGDPTNSGARRCPPGSLYLNPQAEHLLDWFHITMRLTVMTNMAKSLPQPADPDPDRSPPPGSLAASVGKELERLKWFLWHGNVFRALQTVQDLEIDLDVDEPSVPQGLSKRMVKKQQMRWTPRGAHLLLQIRTPVLNDDLAHDFHRWYPGFARTATGQHALAA